MIAEKLRFLCLFTASVHLYRSNSATVFAFYKYNTGVVPMRILMEVLNLIIEQPDHHLRSAEQPPSWWHLSSHEL